MCFLWNCALPINSEFAQEMVHKSYGSEAKDIQNETFKLMDKIIGELLERWLNVVFLPGGGACFSSLRLLCTGIGHIYHLTYLLNFTTSGA